MKTKADLYNLNALYQLIAAEVSDCRGFGSLASELRKFNHEGAEVYDLFKLMSNNVNDGSDITDECFDHVRHIWSDNHAATRDPVLVSMFDELTLVWYLGSEDPAEEFEELSYYIPQFLRACEGHHSQDIAPLVSISA